MPPPTIFASSPNNPVYIFRNIIATLPFGVKYAFHPNFGLKFMLTNPKFSTISQRGCSFFILPNSLFSNVAYKGHTNQIPRIQCLVLFRQNFVLLKLRDFLRFSQFLTSDGGWGGNSFSQYQSYRIFNILSINLFRVSLNFPTVHSLTLH